MSGAPRFRPAHEAYLKNIIAEVPDEDLNGFLAGYVGEKILLGEGKQAWKLMLAYYDRKSDWGLDRLRQVARCQWRLPRQDRAPDLPRGA